MDSTVPVQLYCTEQEPVTSTIVQLLFTIQKLYGLELISYKICK